MSWSLESLRALRLRGRLIALATAALLPVTLLAVAALVLLTRQQMVNLERANLETVRALMAAVDNELNRSIAALQTLAASESLARDDLRRFDTTARRVLGERPSWISILLLEPSGKPILDLRSTPGTSPAAQAAIPVSLDALRTRRPAAGGMLAGLDAREPLFTVDVPVVHAGELRYVLTALVKPDAMLEVIHRQKVPADGLVTIFDPNGVIVARSRAHEQYVGRPVSAGFKKLIAGGGEGWGVSPTVDGQRVYAAYNLSSQSGWGVGLGIPGAAVDAPVQRSYFYLGIGIALSVALGALASVFVARRITGPIAELRAAAAEVGRGAQPALVKSTVPEVRDVANALVAAGEARQRAESAREELLRLEREARAVAENASRSKDEFLAMLGHELRNPLAAIRNAVQVLQLRQPPEATTAEAHRILERQVAHLVHLVDDLLDVERVVTGKIALQRSPLELGTAVRQTLATLNAAGRLERRAIVLQTAEAWVEADATRLDQVVTNLLVNAAKYTSPGGRIEVSVARDGGEAVLSVTDDGIGMEPGLVPKVFDLFVQGERSLDRSQGGLGVGLTLVKRLIELHGGRVAAYSEGSGKGSRFSVRLPALDASAGPAGHRAAVPSAHPRTVLIVEDNPDARAALRQLLEVAGHTVHEASDGPAGFDAALRLRPACAFVDVGLPGYDGYELARRLRAAPQARGMRLVALTGYGQAQDRARALEAGFDSHLVKPVDLETLDRVLGEA